MRVSPLCDRFSYFTSSTGVREREVWRRANENLKALSDEMPATTESGGHSFKSGST